MIKANEFRIGNWVGLKNSDPVKVDVDNIFDIVNNTAIFEPIPLLPEILDKAGFEKKEVQLITNYFIKGGPFYFSILYDPKGHSFLFDSPHYGKLFKYLHELQNLYFALTGEELEIKL